MAGCFSDELPEADRMPALFIGHGSPTNIVMENDFTRSLAHLGRSIAEPQAIMVISAHWRTKGTYLTCAERPRTIHDFYGYPSALYSCSYACPGSPRYAITVKQLLLEHQVQCSYEWGLDHASWGILKHMYPEANIPVFEMSLDQTMPLRYHYDLARELRCLRQRGLLIIGSGNVVHNLQAIDLADANASPPDWAVEFDSWVKHNLLERRHDRLIEFSGAEGIAEKAAPTNEHYLPMLYVAALQEDGESIRFSYQGFEHGAVSMRCFCLES